MSDPKRELAAVITARYSSFDGLSALGIAAAIVEAGWVSEQDHLSEIERYATEAREAQAENGKHIRLRRVAEAKVERVAALADALEHWYGDDSIDDVIAAVRGAIAEFDGTQTSGHISPAAGGTPEAAARKGSQPAVSGAHLGT